MHEQWFVIGTVAWEYLNDKQVGIRGGGRRAWGPFPTEAEADTLTECLRVLKGFTEVAVTRGVLDSSRRPRTVRTVTIKEPEPCAGG